MLRAFGMGATLFAFWLLLSGHYTPMLIGFGVASCALAVYVAHRMDAIDREAFPLHLSGRFWMYAPWLFKETFVSNVAMAKVILDPKLPIDPKIVRITVTQETPIGRVIHANSITMTPGTVTTRVEGNVFEVHAVTKESLEGLLSGEMDRRVTWVERGG